MKNQPFDLYIVDGNITLFLTQDSDTSTSDVLHSSLLASLVSDSHDVSSEEWFVQYKRSMGLLCWVTLQQNASTLARQPCSLLDFLTRQTGATLSPEQLEMIGEAFATIKALPKGSPALSDFLKHVQSSKTDLERISEDNFFTVCPMITLVLQDRMISLRLSFDVDEAVDERFLDEEIPQENIRGDMQVTQWTAYLAEDNYNALRQDVIKKLGSKKETAIFRVSPQAYLVRV
ncbi:hypothetical protein [Pseudomonas sp. NPDC089534]|uniref:hypothetical protein n=1 Tax=Pseudomonas sp. NPDC089534 TaxID=3364468 RepID=UPI00381228D0